MIYTTTYQSPLGNLLLAEKDLSLIGLWIEGQKYYPSDLNDEVKTNCETEVLLKTMRWLDRYFTGQKPAIAEIPLAPVGSEFRQVVWKILTEIPYGTVITYKFIANEIAACRHINQMSAQAVGGAVGHNPISIIIPCHRVVGTNGSLTGYAGGIDKKAWLLTHEGITL